ncbi:MAG: bifunctional glutamate N-acetyltransferase/amino-acid acetyltransferase ArgJ [Granulosicoccaceae bacterium]
MAVNLEAPSELLPVAGVRVAAVEAGIRYKNRLDLALFELSEGSTVAGVYTLNAFCAAPVTVAKEHMAAPRAWLINSGNANAGTGSRGLADARTSCDLVAQALDIPSDTVLPFSTGVISEFLNMDAFGPAIEEAGRKLSEDAWTEAAQAIMTTDTVAKGISRQREIGGVSITMTGIAKGSGMIHPNMATMLGFVATDAAVSSTDLQACLREANEKSFNCVTVDGDTSTNDACVLVATGKSGLHLGSSSPHWSEFCALVEEVMLHLAHALVRDGEGATKFIALQVEGGRDREECKQLAFTVAHSPLVKTAFFASDPNLGRVLAAIGRSGLDQLDVSQIDVALDEVTLVKSGNPAPDYTEARGKSVMLREEITVRIELNRGNASATVWTTDLSHDYVSINADYRS